MGHKFSRQLFIFLFLLPAFVALSSLELSAQSGEPVKIQTHNDAIPNPCNSTNYAPLSAITAVTSGDWSAAGTWNLGRAPNDAEVAFIPAGRSVRVDNTAANARNVCVHGTLTFRENVNTKLVASNIAVFSDGAFQIGTEAAPVDPNVTAEIVLRDTPLNTTVDPAQYLTALLVWGKIRFYGAARTPTWIRLAAEPRANQNTLQLSQTVSGWKAGDRLILPGSNQMPEGTAKHTTHNYEELTVQNISGTTITLGQNLRVDHPGARDLSGKLDFLPHVGNLSRNIIIRSQTPTEVGKAGFCTSDDKLTSPGTCVTRGHTLFTYRADIDVRNTLFKDLGRTLIISLNSTTFDTAGNPTQIGTNQIGRYPIHTHHVMGPYPTIDPQYQYRLVGNAIDGGSSTHQYKWGIAIHNTHYGLIQGQVVYNMGGAGIMFEDGSESFNVLENNFVVRTAGLGPRETGTNATEGTNYYFRGPNNYVRFNVGANALEAASDVEASYFMKYNFVYLGNVRIPNFRGADTGVTGEYTTRNGNAMAILENVGNEGYAGMQGFTNWWTCTEDFGKTACNQNPAVPSGRSVFRDMKLWHFTRYPYYGYPQMNTTFDGWIVRGDRNVLPSCCQPFWWGDYGTYDLIVRRLDIQGTRNVVLPYFSGGTTLVEDSLIGTRYGMGIEVSNAPGSCPGCDLPPSNSNSSDPWRQQVIKNVRFIPFPGQPLETISMEHVTGAADLINRDRTIVCNHNGNASDDFQIYHLEQAASYSLAGDGGQTRGCPGGTMTNQQCWSQFGKAYGGEIASCATQRTSDGFTGFTCSTPLVPSICDNLSGPDITAPGAPRNFRTQ